MKLNKYLNEGFTDQSYDDPYDDPKPLNVKIVRSFVKTFEDDSKRNENELINNIYRHVQKLSLSVVNGKSALSDDDVFQWVLDDIGEYLSSKYISDTLRQKIYNKILMIRK